MTDRSTPHTDPGLVGNDKIENAILALQQEASQELLGHALTVLRHRMQEKGQLILAVEPSAADQLSLKTVQTPDGALWWVAFTSFEEQNQGGGSVMSGFLADMDQLFTSAIPTDGINGIILNPWNRTLMLNKALLQIVLGNN